MLKNKYEIKDIDLDSIYSENVTSSGTDHEPLRKLRILACPANEGGCAYYRIILPMQKMLELHGNEVEVRLDLNPLGFDAEAMKREGKGGIKFKDWTPEAFEWADVVFTQNIHNFGGPYTIEILKEAEKYGCFTHYDNDDLLTDLYEGHRLYKVYKDNQLDALTKHIYANVDMVSVTQRKFAERVAPYVNKALVIIKNAIDYQLPCWNEKKLRPPRKKTTRIGWVGGIHHEEDVKDFPGVASLVNGRVGPENVQWGFYGRPPMPMNAKGEPEPDWQQEVWDNYTKMLTKGLKHRNYQVFTAMPGDKYGMMYTNIDVAIAPLDFNNFNDSKSEIKVAECGRYGIPLVATNCGCYDETIVNGETGYLIDPTNDRREWARILTKLCKDPKHRIEMGQNLKRITDNAFDLGKNVYGRIELYRELIQTKTGVADAKAAELSEIQRNKDKKRDIPAEKESW